MMKVMLMCVMSLLLLGCYSKPEGTLLWESAAVQSGVSKTMQRGHVFMFPNVPLGGVAPDDAMLLGIIDSGVNSAHPQLTGYIKEQKDFTGEGELDELGHGTSVALIALFGLGVEQPKAAIVSAKVVNRDGRINEEHVIDAIKWMANKEIKIVNLSLGFHGSLKDHQELCYTIASYPDVFFVAAAGNSGPDVKVFPAACDVNNLMSVAATDQSGDQAKYSGTGDILTQGRWGFLSEWMYFYELAQKEAVAGNHEQAKVLYQKSISIEDNAGSHFQLGLLELANSNSSEAIVRFKNAINIDPAFAEAYEMLGAALFLEEKFELAEISLRDAIDLYPDGTNQVIARAHYNLGQTLLRLGRKEQAMLEFLETKRLFPGYPNIDAMLEGNSQSK